MHIIKTYSPYHVACTCNHPKYKHIEGAKCVKAECNCESFNRK